MHKKLLALIFGLGLAANPVFADMLDHWHWRHPAPFANSLKSVTYGEGKFVGVSEFGIIHTSPDGLTWDGGQRPVNQTFNRVIHANDQFIAVGNQGRIMTSPDGNNWTPQVSGATNDLLAISYGNGRYVACGLEGRVLVSTNGTAWTPSVVGTTNLNWVTFGNGVFVMSAPRASQGVLAVRVSTDGQNWTTATLPPGHNGELAFGNTLFEVVFSDGAFVASASMERYITWSDYTIALQFYRSYDGTNWTTMATPLWYFYVIPNHRFLREANGVYELLAGTLIRTEDGSSAEVQPVFPNLIDAADVAFGEGRYTLVGSVGKNWTSTDGTAWSSNHSGFRTPVYQVIRGAGKYFAVGVSMPILTSGNGVSFTPVPDLPAQTYGGIAFDGSSYVAVGNNGLLRSSTDGLDWPARTSNTPQNLYGVCRGASRWVAVGGAGAIITSPNALAWTLRASGTANALRSVAHGNGLYVAVGDSGTIVTSPDGTSWDVQFSGVVTNLNRVTYGNGQFVAVGLGGTILTSTDGATWQSRNSGMPGALYGVAYANGYYLAGGFGPSGSSAESALLRSTNGVNWQDISTKLPLAAGVRSLAFHDGSVWVTGDGGAVLQSDSTDGRPRLATGLTATGLQVQVTLNIPASYRIQTTTNLATPVWVDAANIPSPEFPHIWTDTSIGAAPMKFYRLVSP